MSWTIKADEYGYPDKVTGGDWENLDDFIQKITGIITPTQFWAAVEAMTQAKEIDQVLEEARREAEEQDLVSPDDLTWADLDHYIDGRAAEGWAPQDIITAIEDAYPQTWGSPT